LLASPWDELRLSEFPALEENTKDLAQDEEPFLRMGQLLRSIANGRQEQANRLQSRAHLGSLGVHAGDRDGGSPAVSGLLADGVQQ